MWLGLVLLAIFVDGLSGILIRYRLKDCEEISSMLKVFIGFSAITFLVLLAIYALGLSESGDTPWMILYHKPAILIPITCSVLYYVFMLQSFCYIRVADFSVIDSFSGVLIFLGIILVNAILGGINGANDLLDVKRLLPLAGMLIGAFLLNREEKRIETISPPKIKNTLAIGIALAAISTFFDAADTVCTSFLLSAEDADSWDFIAAYAFLFSAGGALSWIYITFKNRKIYNPFAKAERICLLVGLLECITDIADTQATALNAVRVQVAWIVAPIVPILLAYFILKERFSARQGVFMTIVLVCSGLFALAELI